MSKQVPILSQEDQAKLESFIGKSVLTGSLFPGINPGSDTLTVQSLLHERSVETLRKLGMAYEKLAEGKSSRFAAKKTSFKLGGLPIEDVLEGLELIINYREGIEAAEKKAKEIAELKSQLEELQTPGEIKAKLQTKLAELEGIIEAKVEAPSEPVTA